MLHADLDGTWTLALKIVSPESCQFATEKPRVSYTPRVYLDKATLYNSEFSTIPRPASGSHSKFPHFLQLTDGIHADIACIASVMNYLYKYANYKLINIIINLKTNI